MKNSRRLFCAVAVPLDMALATLPSLASAQNVKRSDQYITVLTGPSSGIYFPIGGAFSTLIGKLGYKASATATGATAENINALQTGQGEIAIAMSDAVIQAVEAFGAYEGKKPAANLRSLMGFGRTFARSSPPQIPGSRPLPISRASASALALPTPA